MIKVSRPFKMHQPTTAVTVKYDGEILVGNWRWSLYHSVNFKRQPPRHFLLSFFTQVSPKSTRGFSSHSISKSSHLPSPISIKVISVEIPLLFDLSCLILVRMSGIFALSLVSFVDLSSMEIGIFCRPLCRGLIDGDFGCFFGSSLVDLVVSC